MVQLRARSDLIKIVGISSIQGTLATVAIVVTGTTARLQLTQTGRIACMGRITYQQRLILTDNDLSMTNNVLGQSF